MDKVGRGAFASLALPLVAAMLISVPASTQPARPAVPPDISGEWRLDNNEQDTTAQPPLGDYLGIPFNDAGRMRSDTTAESLWGTPEYQCRPHSAPHQWRGLGGARILKEQDPLTRNVSVYHIQFMRSLDRPVFMDGRPHPPAYAPHTWTGFSTGEWLGNTLKITTTHLKDGYLKRGGPQTSDMLTMTEYITRHAEILTIVTSVDDPIYMDEPYVESTTYTYGAFSTFVFRQDAGPFYVGAGVRTDATAPSVTEIYNEIRKMKDVEVTLDELTLGKDSLVRSMPGRFETSAQTVDSFATLFVYNLGLDYYSKYIERIGTLNAAGVHAAARKHLVPERMLVVAVGDRQKIEADLAKLNLGPMELRDPEGNVVKPQ